MIRVGDEVVYCGGDNDAMWKLAMPDDLYEKRMTSKFVVTKLLDDENGVYICGFGSDGSPYYGKDLRYWKPTGRYFPEVEELLEKLKEETK